MRPRLIADLSELTKQSSSRGGIEIYTGEGKGKSTSALGKALQAIGKGTVSYTHLRAHETS